MKKSIYLIALAIAMVVLIAGCAADNKENENKALAISDIQYDPLSFTGEISLTGINVALYMPDPTIFFLMDTEELLLCKNLQCGAFQLPVTYTGSDPMPELADEVVITGSWVEYVEDGNSITIFGATSITVNRNVMDILMS